MSIPIYTHWSIFMTPLLKCNYQREYYLLHREKKLAAAKERHEQKKESINKYTREWRLAHPGYGTECKDRWRAENPTKEKALKKRSHQNRSAVPQYRVVNAISQNIRRYLHKGKENKSWRELVDFSPQELAAHLERQFSPGMSWENYGQWHIDHKIPVSVFNFSTPKDIDFKRCWSLKNLRPLWAKENISKGNKLNAPFQPSLTLEHLEDAVRRM